MYRSYMYSTITILIHHSHHTPGDKLQQHFAATEPSSWVQVWQLVAAKNRLCVLENVCEDLCLCYLVLLPWQVAQIVSDLIFCVMLHQQNSVAGTKIFTKILLYKQSDLSLRCVAATWWFTFACDLYTSSDLSQLQVAATVPWLPDLHERNDLSPKTWLLLQLGLILKVRVLGNQKWPIFPRALTCQFKSVLSSV